MKNFQIKKLLYSIFVSVYYLFKTRKKFAYSFLAVFIAAVVILTSVLAAKSISASDKKVNLSNSGEVSQETKTLKEEAKVKSEEKEPEPPKEEQPEEEKPEDTASNQEVAAEPTEETPVEEAPAEQPVEEVPAEQPAEEAPAEQPVAEAPAEQPAEETPAEPPSNITNRINVVPGGKSNTDPDDNDFLDALIYSGYNIEKHRSDGLMWVYILAANKKAKGWLSNITYNFGCTGYETTADGKPDIARFEAGGLVCASYATYVYFNYLPNVAGIDVSALARPADPQKAQQWYLAGQKWIADGYSKSIAWNAHPLGGTNLTVFEPAEPIPIGSLMLTQDFNNRNGYATHISLYAGYKNGYHWVTHVGNVNGPEFCAMERMSCGPDPQWPLAIITTPNGIVK